MGLILDGNSEHVELVWKNHAIFEEEKITLETAVDLNLTDQTSVITPHVGTYLWVTI